LRDSRRGEGLKKEREKGSLVEPHLTKKKGKVKTSTVPKRGGKRSSPGRFLANRPRKRGWRNERANVGMEGRRSRFGLRSGGGKV